MKKVLFFVMLVFVTGLLFSCSSDDPNNGGQGGGPPGSTGSLAYEGQTYQMVIIGTQTWMAENLNYNPGTGNSACYDNGPNNCNTYGRLYDWSTAMDLSPTCNENSCSSQIQAKHRGICPSGWHIPSNDDWDILMNYVGYETAGKHLKSRNGWEPYSGIENLDTYGFSALPGGSGGWDGSFHGVGLISYWWSASERENSSHYVYYRIIHYDSDYVIRSNNSKFSSLHYVRCVRD